MELYENKSSSTAQKIFIVIAQIVLLVIAYKILFNGWGDTIYKWLSLDPPHKEPIRSAVNLTFSLIVFMRITFMMFFLMRRSMPLEEAVSIPVAFSIYYVGFPLLTIQTPIHFHGTDYIGITAFIIGSFTNTFSEIKRYQWKQKNQHEGKLYTKGLFQYSMHINYFGDLLWVIGYATIARNGWAWLVPLFLSCFFIFYNIPKLDAYLEKKYKDQFLAYRSATKRFIPFIY